MIWKIGELLYIKFLRESMDMIGIYQEEFDTEHFLFWWPDRTKIHHIYHIILKEVNGDHK